MKKILIAIMFMLFAAVCSAQAKEKNDSIEYKLVQITEVRKLYYIQEDNEDGTINVKIQNNKKGYAYSYQSRMQALREYTSKGWQVVDMDVVIYNQTYFVYQLKRKK